MKSDKFIIKKLYETAAIIFDGVETSYHRCGRRYTRNLVDEGNGKFNLMILCWGENHGWACEEREIEIK